MVTVIGLLPTDIRKEWNAPSVVQFGAWALTPWCMRMCAGSCLRLASGVTCMRHLDQVLDAQILCNSTINQKSKAIFFFSRLELSEMHILDISMHAFYAIFSTQGKREPNPRGGFFGFVYLPYKGSTSFVTSESITWYIFSTFGWWDARN